MKLNKMSKLNKKTTSILIITILMLSMAIALPAAATGGIKITSPLQFASGDGGSADWTHTKSYTGGYSVLLDDGSEPATSFGTFYLTIDPILLSSLTTDPSYMVYETKVVPGYHPYVNIFIDFDGVNPGEGSYGTDWTAFEGDLGTKVGGVDPLVDTWTEMHSASYYGAGTTYTLGASGTLAEIKTALETLLTPSVYATAVVYKIQIQYGKDQAYNTEPSKAVYVDDIKVKGLTYPLEDKEGSVGTKTIIAGYGATPLGRIKAYWDGLEDIDELTTTPPTVKADGTGAFTFSITVPEDFAGIHYISVEDMMTSTHDLTGFTIKPKIVLNPTAGIIGDTITVTGTGFAAKSKITITGSTGLTIAPSSPTTSALGSFTGTFKISTALDGPYTITATDSATPPNSAIATITVGTCITLTPKKGLTGITVTVVGRDFTPTDIIDVRWEDYLTLINDYKIDATGAFTKTFTVPAVDPGTYIVKAVDSDTEALIAKATYTVIGTTKITLTPTSDLAGETVSVTGVWFTKGKTVTIYFDGVSVGTATAATALDPTDGYVFPATDITIPADATLGAHTIKAMDSEGVYATATFTVIEVVITIETRSASYDPDDTISFTIESTVEFVEDPIEPLTFGDIDIEIDDPDGTIFWDLEWKMIGKTLPATGYYVPYSAQTAKGHHLTLPSDADEGTWTWIAEYYLLSAPSIKLTATDTFTVGEAEEPEPEPVTDISLSVGWNLVSLPLIPDDSDIEVVLEGLVGVESVWTYDSGVWYSYTPGAPSDLDDMVDGEGYWMKMTAAATLAITGTEMPVDPFDPLPAYPVVEGYNLVGFKSTLPMTVSDYLAGVEYARVYGYVDGYHVLTASDYMTPGRGYWIAASAPGTIYP